jgi:hypothetical protein
LAHCAYLLAAECSAGALREHIGHLLNGLGLDAPALAERTALTTTERSMVQMSLDGAFDQEIAQALSSPHQGSGRRWTRSAAGTR